jgi:hypothetical protein
MVTLYNAEPQDIAASVVGFRGPLQNHMVRTAVVPLRRIAIFGQLCS